MTVNGATSRCSSGKQARFRWFGYPQSPMGKDLETAAEKFLEVISSPARLMNEYVSSMAVAEFKHLIRIAQSGRLTPQRDIKPIVGSKDPLLFEIRWQSITVQERKNSGDVEDKRLLVRMYHSEPEIVPGYFIAHHIHEKVISGDAATWLAQNEEIATAIGFYHAGINTHWGIQP
jgi:hypothetical protein